nr:MAG TPA: replisome organizer protein [Bacteriophage sp.]
MNIPDKWKNELNSLSQKDYITLTKAILFDLPEPQISENNQYIADRIYEGFKKTEYNKIAKRKSRKSNGSQFDVNLTSNGSQTEVNLTSSKEEKREASPPCSPSSFPPHPLINSPYNPPLEEKREEALTGVCAGACEDEQISFEGFEPLDPPESEVKHRKPTIAERFEALWAEYPKKNGKKNAFESYQRAIAAGVTDETIADGIKRYKDYIAVKRTSEQYILAGSTYFYQWRWQDIYDTVSVAPTCSEKSGGDEFLNYLNEELEKEKAKRESRWTEQT